MVFQSPQNMVGDVSTSCPNIWFLSQQTSLEIVRRCPWFHMNLMFKHSLELHHWLGSLVTCNFTSINSTYQYHVRSYTCEHVESHVIIPLSVHLHVLLMDNTWTSHLNKTVTIKFICLQFSKCSKCGYTQQAIEKNTGINTYVVLYCIVLYYSI